MKIGYLVGRLGRGGAELQLMILARAMAQLGHRIEVLSYDGPSPFDDDLRRSGVAVRTSAAAGRAGKVAATRSWFEALEPDIVHGVMKRASTLAVLARLPRRRPRIVATDMSTATYGRHKPILWASLAAFHLADRIVTQTETNRRNLERLAPWLRGKTVVIRNGLDVQRFTPPAPVVHADCDVFRFCVAGTVYAVKNPDRVVRAVAELVRRGRSGISVDWYGRLARPYADVTAARHATLDLVDQLGVGNVITFHGDTAAIDDAYRSADALLHASVQEGFPNVVAEGMACGLPIVVSRVSDLPLVVRTANNGYVFDELDVGSIADAMERMADTPPEERRAMGQRSRELAVRWFGLDRFANEFAALYRRLLENR